MVLDERLRLLDASLFRCAGDGLGLRLTRDSRKD
jgi:hypothetical protein